VKKKAKQRSIHYKPDRCGAIKPRCCIPVVY